MNYGAVCVSAVCDCSIFSEYTHSVLDFKLFAIKAS